MRRCTFDDSITSLTGFLWQPVSPCALSVVENLEEEHKNNRGAEQTAWENKQELGVPGGAWETFNRGNRM